MTTSRDERMPTVFIPHGGGPWPLMPLPFFTEEATRDCADYLRSLSTIPNRPPRALLVISAHWEEAVPTVHNGPAPGMLFDYTGFPPEAYELAWPAPGAPVLAGRVEELLERAGIEAATNSDRGFDHGVFVPLMLAYPDASVPTVQLSLADDLDPERHIAVGRALASLRDEGVFIVGSGNSCHNMTRDPGVDIADGSRAFDAWFAETVALEQPQRDERLIHWAAAPGAAVSHPREEHLAPLFVVAGAAGSDPGSRAWSGKLGSMQVSSAVFG